MDTKKILLQINNASFRYHSGDFLFEGLKLTINAGDRIAIVGANGVGKSTLLKIFNGRLKPELGDITINCSPYYVPQVDLTVLQKNVKLYEYIADQYDEWWDVISEITTIFDTELDAEKEMGSLSGGELMKVNLAIAIKHKPDVLLMDEPTNHLDIKSVNTLTNFLKSAKCAYVIISHDIFFLDQAVTTIFELEKGKVTTYGGNYTFYKEQKELHLRGIKKQYDIAIEKIEHAKMLAQKVEEKAAKKANTMKRAFIKGGVDRREWGKAKDTASSSQGGRSIMLEKLATDAEEKLETFDMEERKLAFISLKNTSGNIGRTLFSVEDSELMVGNKILLKNLNLKVTYGDRIVISGENGSGKTSLIKALTEKSDVVKLKGVVTKADNVSWVYIDQNYSLIKPDLTLVQNMVSHHKSITESKAKEQLGKFQFKTDYDIKKLGSQLSGGEMVRLMMAMITSWPIDLVVLDEPTNNLDAATIDVLIKALNGFVGAIIVISHNMDFLSKINIEHAFVISKGKLREMRNLPKSKELYHLELIKLIG